MGLEDDLARLACRQRGLVSRAQAIGLGLMPSQIDQRLRMGRWETLRPRVYIFAGVPRTREQLVLATTLSLGPGVYASHDTALRLFGGRARVADEVVEVSADRHRQVRMDGVRAHRSLLLFDADRSSRLGIPATAPARLVVDLSGRRSTAALGGLTDDLLRRRLLRLPELAQCVSRLVPAPGRSLRRVEAILRARWDGYDPGDSDLESRVLRVIVAAGLPVPRQQLRVKIDGRRRYIDLGYPEVKLALEIDSWAYHRFRSTFDADRAKSNELTLLGWRVLRVTDGMSDRDIVGLVGRALQALVQFTAS